MMKRPKRPGFICPFCEPHVTKIEKYATQTESKLKIVENLLLRSNEVIINLQEEIDEYFRVEEK